MKTIMTLDDLTTVDQLKNFLSGTQALAFSVISARTPTTDGSRGRWCVSATYPAPTWTKGVVIRYLMKVSGYSRQQLTHLVRQYRDTCRFELCQRAVAGFANRYTLEDIRLLAAMDERHEPPCGPIARKLCERAYQVLGQRYAALLQFC